MLLQKENSGNDVFTWMQHKKIAEKQGLEAADEACSKKLKLQGR